MGRGGSSSAQAGSSLRAAEPAVSFDCKADSPETAWITIEYPAGQMPNWVSELRDAGWENEEDRGLRAAPAAARVIEGEDGPEIEQDGPLIAETHFSKRGSGLFGEWSEPERKQNLDEAREILSRHGFDDVPLNERPWQDFI